MAVLPAPLPSAPATAPLVAPAVRLAYVQRQLARAYPGAPVELLGHAAGRPRVEVAELGANFFRHSLPYPPAPNWRMWQGQRVPFFFDDPARPLLTVEADRVVLGADLIAAAFYLLSGWQEYFSDERDQHGRFPYAASVQAQYGFVALPVVNYYFEVLKTALEHVSGQRLLPRRWGARRATFAAFISHDVDNLRSAWKTPAKVALQQGRLLPLGRLLGRRLLRPDAWDNLEAVASAVAQYGGRSTFFILPSRRKAPNGTPNADYHLTRRLRQRLQLLRAQGCEVALHGSLGTATKLHQLNKEWREEMRAEAQGIRFHYLSWEPRLTLSILDTSGLRYDSTLGFAEHFGFRHGYCLPFQPFNFAANKESDCVELPLNVMDATLYHPRYLQLTPTEMMPALAPMLQEIKRFGGVASILWHNENFDPANQRNGPRQFHELMRYLQQQGAAFLTGQQVHGEFVGPYPAT